MKNQKPKEKDNLPSLKKHRSKQKGSNSHSDLARMHPTDRKLTIALRDRKVKTDPFNLKVQRKMELI